MTDWYHSIELPGGTVTPGWFDLRPSAAIVPLPADLNGKRCLDVGTWDGFWAFEMERRGATEVVAIDVEDPDRWDWPPRERLADRRGGLAFLSGVKPPGANFAAAAGALGSKARRLDLSVYDLDPEDLAPFDLAFVGSLLLHLRDPVGALDRVRAMLAPNGQVVVADVVDPLMSWLHPRSPVAHLEGVERPWWWLPNRAALHQMVRSAGFDIQEATRVYFVRRGAGHPPARLRDARRPGDAFVALLGVPHAAVRARPLG